MSKDLEHLRQEIDKIDDKIFDLLIERLKFVSKVGEHKKSTTIKKPILRPGREAKMIQNIYNKATSSDLNKNVSLGFANIWRNIISSAVNHEDDLKILISKPNEAEKLVICRDYMGPYTSIQILDNDSTLLKLLENNESNISILQVENKYQTKPWWLEINDNEELNIFARPPLINNTNTNSYFFAISNIKPEPIGNDKFIYSLKGEIPTELADNHKIISSYEDYKLIESDISQSNFSKNFEGEYLGCYSFLVND